jgi:hypothetical protein
VFAAMDDVAGESADAEGKSSVEVEKSAEYDEYSAESEEGSAKFAERTHGWQFSSNWRWGVCGPTGSFSSGRLCRIRPEDSNSSFVQSRPIFLSPISPGFTRLSSRRTRLVRGTKRVT